MQIIKLFPLLSCLFILSFSTLSTDASDIPPKSAHIVKGKFLEQEEDYSYERTSNKTNFFNFFKSIDLEKDGISDAVWSWSGYIAFIVKYKREMYIVKMYRDEGVFGIRRVIKVQNGRYYAHDVEQRDVYLPKLYKKLKYLLPAGK